MATTFIDYTGDGNATKSFSFPSIQVSDVKVEVDNVLKTSGVHYNITSYTTTGGGNVVFTSGNIPASPADIRIFRETDVDSAKATYTAGSSVKAGDLNANHEQLLFGIQEEQNQTIQTHEIKDSAVTTAKIKDANVTTAKIADLNVTRGKLEADAVDGTKIADDSINSEHYIDGSIDHVHLANDLIDGDNIIDDAINSEHYAPLSIDTEHIANENVTTAKLAADAVTASKLADNAVVTANIVDANVTTAKLAADAVDGTKIADDSINSEHYVDGSIDTAHIADAQITTAKIADGAITDAKIQGGSLDNRYYTETELDAGQLDNRYYTETELDAGQLDNRYFTETELTNGALDGRYFTETEADARYFNISTGDTIKDGDTFPDNDTTIATTAAINDRIIDLVDDVGGFVPIANETSFPTANPDVNNGSGTLVSIKGISSTRTPSGGTVTIANGAGTGNTVTITGCGSTVLTAGFGVIVETTSTLHTYAFHRLVPKATEVTTVAGISSNITTVANNTSNINAVAADASDIGTVAGSITNVNNVGNSITNVNTTAGSIANVNTVAGSISNVNSVASNISNVNAVNSNESNINSAVSNASNINSAVSNASNINSVAGSITNVNTAANSISNINTVAGSISNVNSFFNVYRIGSNNPTSSLDTGDLFFNTTSNSLKVYTGSAWVDGVTTTGDFALKTGNTFTGSNIHNDNVKSLYGTGSDLEIYHNGSNSIIHNNGTGDLKIIGDDVHIQATNDEAIAKFIEDGAVELYHNGTKKFETTNAGVDVTGNIVVSGNVDGRDVAADGTKLDGISTGAIANVVQDTTPQLGGDLDVQSNKITTATSNGNVKIEPNGTGVVEIRGAGGNDGTLQLNCSAQSHGIKLKSPPHSAAQSYTLTFPSSIVNNGALKTDSSGNLSFGLITNTNVDASAAIARTKLANVDVVDDTSPQLGGNLASNGNDIIFADNDKALFGTGSDFEIFFNGTNTSLYTGTGDITIQTAGDDIQLLANDDIQLLVAGGVETAVNCIGHGAVELYHDNSKKLNTKSDGVLISGELQATHLDITGSSTIAGNVNHGDNVKAQFGAGSDLQIFHDGSHSRIKDTGTGNLALNTSKLTVYNAADSEPMIIATENGSVELYHDNSKKLETTSSGVTVTGTVAATSFTGDGSNLTGVSSAEIYGFNTDANGNLIVTTTNGGADNISGTTFDAFEDVVFAATGISFSVNASGNLIATI